MNRMAATAPDYNDAIERYIEKGIDPGSFLTAILSNQIMEAYMYADFADGTCMHSWAKWLYNYGDERYWGTPEIVEKWIESHKGERDE